MGLLIKRPFVPLLCVGRTPSRRGGVEGSAWGAVHCIKSAGLGTPPYNGKEHLDTAGKNPKWLTPRTDWGGRSIWSVGETERGKPTGTPACHKKSCPDFYKCKSRPVNGLRKPGELSPVQKKQRTLGEKMSQTKNLYSSEISLPSFFRGQRQNLDF